MNERLPDNLPAWISPRRAALLVVDTQVDFASPEGAMGRAGVDLSAAPAALAAAERLAASARAAGAPVIFVGLETTEESESPVWVERARRLGAEPGSGSALCQAGTTGAAFVGPAPRAGELVVAKSRYSAFFRTDLDARLRARGVDTLVVCGLTTECCVDCTVRDAFHLDYHVFLAGDACAAYEADLHAGALKSLGLNCAIIVTTDEVVGAWRTGSADPPTPPAGA